MAHTHLQLPDTRLLETEWGVHETTVHAVRRYDGVAGQVAYSVDVTTSTYPHNEDEGETVTDESTHIVLGSTYGSPGPVFAIVGGMQTYVDSPARFGDTFDAAWAYRFTLGREVD